MTPRRKPQTKPRYKYKTLRIWVNVYDGSGGVDYVVYDSKEEADEYASITRITCVELKKRYKVPVKGRRG